MAQNDNRQINIILNEMDTRIASLETRTTLSALSLAASSITENSASGTVVGGILGKTSGSTLSLFNDDGGRFAISGTNLVAGLTNIDYEAATSRSIVLRETLAGATNSPRDTSLAVGVVNVFEQPSLRALLLSSTSLTIGTPTNGAITEAATGSAIAATGLPAGYTINGPARTWAYDGSGPAAASTIALTETLGDSPNSPRQTAIGVTIAAAATGMPQQARLLAHWRAEDITPQANDTEVKTWTDRIGGLVAKAITSNNGGPRYTPNKHNGLPSLAHYMMGMSVEGFAGSAFETATLAGNATIIYVMDDIYNGDCPGGSYQGTGTFWPHAGSQTGFGMGNSTVPFQAGGGFTTMAIELGAGQFTLINGGAVWQHYESYTFGGNFNLGSIRNGTQWFGGHLCEVIVYQGNLTQAEHIQLEKFLRTKRAQAMPWAANANYHVFDGDSLTRGQGITNENPSFTYPYKVAEQLGLKYGAWTNVALGGRAYENKPNNAGQGIDARATAGLDTIPALIGKNTYLYAFEWINQNFLTTNSAQTINAAKTYLQHRVAAGFKVVFGTSTDFNASADNGAATRRADYNAYWDTAANRVGLMDKYVPLHTDPNVGVAGSCPQNGTGNTYFTSDGIHLTGAAGASGYTAIANNFIAAGTTA